VRTLPALHNFAEPEPCQRHRSIGLVRINSLEPTGCGETPRLLRRFTTLIRPGNETFRDFWWAHCLRKSSQRKLHRHRGGQMDPHKSLIDSTDLLRGICDAQLSADNAALAAVLRDAAAPEDAGSESYRAPAKSQLRRPERGPGLRATRRPTFDAQRASW
jgi:hypothetical protein